MGVAPSNSSEDILRWPDGSWCYREDLATCHWKSDDYEVIRFGTPEYDACLEELL